MAELRAFLDAQYSPSRVVPTFRSILRRYRTLSNEAKELLPCELDVAYGESPAERCHYFPPLQPPGPLFVYVHGGHWQELDIDDSCFPALDLVPQGVGFMAIGYELAPAGSIESMVRSVGKALAWAIDHGDRLGTSAGHVFAGGTSAGAHLLAMAISRGSLVPTGTLAGAILMSGVYDLNLIPHTYVNDLLCLSSEDAERYSPVHFLPLRAKRVVVARAEVETHEYRRQQDLLIGRLSQSEDGRETEVTALTSPGRNHFDLAFDIGKPNSLLGGEVHRVMFAES